MNNVCFNEKNGIRRLGYIENYMSYGDELKSKISVDFYYKALDDHIDNEIDKGHIYYYDKNFEPVSGDDFEKKYKIIDTGYKEANTDKKIYAGFKLKKTWYGVELGTKEEIFLKWEEQKNEENISDIIFFRNISSLSSILCKFTGKEINELYTRKLIEDAYKKAAGTNAVYCFTNDTGKSILYFDANIETFDKEKIWLISEPNTKKDANQKWFGLFFVRQSELLKRIFNMEHFNISGMVFEDSNQANAFINALSEKAISESWTNCSNEQGLYDLPVLKSYLENTYARLCKEAEKNENKMVEKNGYMYFNSGLLDKFYRQIFIRGEIRVESNFIEGIGEYHFSYLANLIICSENEAEIAMIFTSNSLPELASYCDDYHELIFDASLEIKLQDSHIFEDGVRRHRISAYTEAYEECKDDIQKYNSLMANISRDFESAINRMKLISKRNYTVAVPQYVKEFDEIQYMLPIYLDNNNKIPDCILSLKLERNAAVPYYIGTTILTPEMAINNARLITGPDFQWINNIKSA